VGPTQNPFERRSTWQAPVPGRRRSDILSQVNADEGRVDVTGQRPRVLVCLHGAGTFPSVFDAWTGSFPKWQVVAPDLHAGLDLSTASMRDYANAAVTAAASPVPDAIVALCGWSMGGLVALMAAPIIRPVALVLLEPSLPAELAGHLPNVPLNAGTFEPAELYGRWPEDPPTRPESSLAMGERKRGVSVPSVQCPLLVVAGKTYGDQRGSPVAAFYGGELAYFPHLHHVSLVREVAVRTTISDWLSQVRGTST
jgi:pimeloyl-ACP methyl ester carboxylesterase